MWKPLTPCSLCLTRLCFPLVTVVCPCDLVYPRRMVLVSPRKLSPKSSFCCPPSSLPVSRSSDSLPTFFCCCSQFASFCCKRHLFSTTQLLFIIYACLLATPCVLLHAARPAPSSRGRGPTRRPRNKCIPLRIGVRHLT